ncbi:E3 ubiquitin-protein ligase SPL2 isoform X1 [Cynara cardunculus var. scolymus]|uniref:RING-type E3 ubiquitin transferase n=1 Tax=Cynara cardunculus var. scolymus TaxID=59895 RepID=A0A118JUQ6_CYNCS|nr:E3 ubiquitin-protein ligase SPL2 isoform X1 [Cynara cardunculus var. scolymus]KVH92902.1 E3 Ubiquitin ligase [Cynara cardunculus var. scolymus]
MSVHDQAAVAVLSQVALAADGAVLGLALAYIAVRSVLKYKTTSSALNKVKKAPSVGVSDLRSVLSHSSDQDTDTTSCVDEKLVIVRGVVEAKSVVNGNWKKQNVLVSHESNEKAVILQRTQTCIYNEWRGFFGWTSDFRSLFARHWKEQESSSLRTVPFILVDGGRWPQSDYLAVNLDGSKHPLPLTTVYHNLQPINASPYTFLQAFFGHEYPVGLLDEEKILPVGKEITAVGLVSLRNGIPEVMACKDLPFFLSNMSKDQMVVELDFRTKVLLWSGVVIGSLATAILGYSVVRNWNRWKEWRQRRQIQQQNAAEESSEAEADVAAEEGGDVPEGQLCVICLMRQRRSAFVPCGHLVCCPRCALSVERDLSPKCPVCRQTIRSSVRIYDS